MIENEKIWLQHSVKCLQHQFVASALAVKLGHEIISESQIGCMLLYAPVYAYDSNPVNVMYAKREADIFNFLCGDVQVRGEYPYFVNIYFKENEVELEIQEGDLEIIKKYTVDFISLSYY